MVAAACSPRLCRVSCRNVPFDPELFAALQSLSESVAEMRVGQILAAIGELCADLHGRGLWDATEAELVEAVWRNPT